MKTILPWILFLLTIVAAIVFFSCGPKSDNSEYEKLEQLYVKQIDSLNQNIDSLTVELDKKKTEYDTIEKIRIVYRDNFDTEAAKEVINDESIDSTCRNLLKDCVDLQEVNELAITKLKAINTDNECLVEKLQEKNQVYKK